MQDKDLMLLAKFQQNPKSVNKVIAQLMKNFIVFVFHCYMSSFFTHDVHIALNIWKKVQLKQLAYDEVIVTKV